jgi:hypothetical protein
MKKLLLVLSCCVISFAAHAADKDLSCGQINAELFDLRGAQGRADNAALADSAAGTAHEVAREGANLSGHSASMGMIDSIGRLTKRVTSSVSQSSSEKAVDAERRIIKLETIAEMKGCP